VLPETPETRREPGIWAGDGPKASAEPDAPVRVLDAAFPRPDDPEMTYRLEQCAGFANKALVGADSLLREVLALSKFQRACAAATILHECAVSVRLLYESKAVPDLVLVRTLKRAEQMAVGRLAAACPEGMYGPLKDIIGRWSAAMQYGGGQ
jgi:hypothetical protein